MRRTLTLALALAIASIGATAAQAATDTIRRGFNVAPGGTLRLDAGVGSVKIVTGGTGVAFEVIREAEGSKAQERLADHRITFSQQGNDVIVESDFDHSWSNNWRFFDRYEVQWNVRVPDNYHVEVKTSGGSIELDDIGGNVDARTSGGSITSGKVSGRAELRTSGGSVTVEGASGEVHAHSSGGSIRVGETNGPVEARTSGGSITLARVDGDVIARTSGGSIRIEDATGAVDARTSGGSISARMSRQPRADSHLSTSGGGITVTLASGIGADLDARASGGGVHSDVPITVMGRQDDDSLNGEINGGGPKLVLRTSGGGIRVKPIS